eukprot:gene5107-148_t
MAFPWSTAAATAPAKTIREAHPGALAKHKALPPISSEDRSKRKLKGSSVTFAGSVASEDSDKMTIIERKINAAEQSTRTVLREALRIQTDIDNSFQMNQTLWRDEKKQRELLVNHISSITHVVKSLSSREMDELETRIAEQIVHIRRHCDTVQNKLDSSFSQLGFTHAQQEHVNARVREGFQTLTASQQLFQNAIQDQMRRICERIDNLSVQVNHTLATKTSTDSLGHIHTAGLNEAQAVLSVRIDSLDGKVSQLLQDVKSLTENISELRLLHEQEKTSTRAAVNDTNQSISQITLEQKHALETMEEKLSTKVQSIVRATNDAWTSSLQELEKQFQKKLLAVREDMAQKTTQELTRNIEMQNVSHSKLEEGMVRLDKWIHDIEKKIQKLKNQQREQVQTIDLLATALDEKTSSLSKRLEGVIKSVVIV